VNTVVWCLLSGLLCAGIAYWFLEKRRKASLDAQNGVQTQLSLSEARLTDLTKQFAAQTEELRAANSATGELSKAHARLEANIEQAEDARAQLVREKDSLDQELREERRLRIGFETAEKVASGSLQDLSNALGAARERNDALEKERRTASDRIADLTGNRDGLSKEVQGLREQLAAQRTWIDEQTTLFEQKVLAAAATLMEERGKVFTETNKSQVDAVIAPFKEQLAEFRTRVDYIYTADTRERGELRQQIEHLTNLNQAVSTQAERLTNALTVTSKSTGDWGETILQKILEDSGLREGKEYRLQHSIKDADGARLQPDAVIFLPEGRQLVVDAKVSNKAWTAYCAASDDVAKAGHLKEHLASLRAHIKSLSAKDYAASPELQTADFVLMFAPVETALLTALAKDDSLYADAYRSKIILVTPSTLMAVVKLVEGIWTFQKRKESADEIADAGRKLFEKLTTFATTFVEVGEAIQRAQGTFEKAQGQLATGKGNAIRLAQRMVELGVSPPVGKSMPLELTSNLGDEYEDVIPTPPSDNVPKVSNGG
jgi:DNA recombination protein RmuC